ncbi:MAG: glutathione S-transferase [Pseudomonadales bacterium]|nr:MAPEG family protein [Gammaproteobacteria bacterium]NNL57281.1 glutathione S-transferase [Pseudomonadales bacterium]
MANSLTITALYAALLGLLFIPFTARVGIYRARNQINLGDGGDPELLKRIRGQANFVETVPLALLLIALMELAGASTTWLHVLGILLVTGRIAHYLQITGFVQPLLFRGGGMGATIFVYLAGSVWLLLNAI